MQRRRNRLLRRVPALLAAIACLVATGSPQPLGSAGAAAPTSAATTPAQPVPAPASAQNGLDATSSVAPSNAGGTSAPAASTATPTTTYAPSNGTALPSATPSTTPGATPGTAPGAATPGAAASPPAVTTPATSAAQPATPAQGRTTAKGDRPLSTGAIVIAALAALLVLVCAAWGIARLTAFEPRWSISLRHSMAEAGFRVSATWSEFTDWVRLGH
jgi:hypothetical protein